MLRNRAQTARPTLEKTRDLMNRKIPGGLVEGFEPLIEILTLPDENDPHVLELAIHAEAQIIVTRNTADFRLQFSRRKGSKPKRRTSF